MFILRILTTLTQPMITSALIVPLILSFATREIAAGVAPSRFRHSGFYDTSDLSSIGSVNNFRTIVDQEVDSPTIGLVDRNQMMPGGMVKFLAEGYRFWIHAASIMAYPETKLALMLKSSNYGMTAGSSFSFHKPPAAAAVNENEYLNDDKDAILVDADVDVFRAAINFYRYGRLLKPPGMSVSLFKAGIEELALEEYYDDENEVVNDEEPNDQVVGNENDCVVVVAISPKSQRASEGLYLTWHVIPVGQNATNALVVISNVRKALEDAICSNTASYFKLGRNGAFDGYRCSVYDKGIGGNHFLTMIAAHLSRTVVQLDSRTYKWTVSADVALGAEIPSAGWSLVFSKRQE